MSFTGLRVTYLENRRLSTSIISKTTIPATVAMLFFGLLSSRRTKWYITRLYFHDIKICFPSEITGKLFFSKKCPRMAIFGGKILKLGKSHSFSIRTHLQLSGFWFSHFCPKRPTLVSTFKHIKLIILTSFWRNLSNIWFIINFLKSPFWAKIVRFRPKMTFLINW